MEIVTPSDTGPTLSRVLVVGGSGFVGSAIVRAIQATSGLHAIGASRRSQPAGTAIEHRQCDATDPASLLAATDGVDAVVLCMLGSARQMTAATRAVCQAALARPRLRQVVLISSMSVYGPVEGLIQESDPLDGEALGSYGRAKVACERIAADYIARGCPVTTLRPGIVYGPGGEQWVGRLGRLLRAGRLGDLGAMGDGICNLVLRDDVGAAVVAALSTRASIGAAFNLSDGGSGTWNDYLVTLGCLAGYRRIRRISARRLALETRVIAPPLHALRLTMPASARTLLPELISPALAKLFSQRLRLCCDNANAVLGFKPTPRAHGIALSAAWLRQANKASPEMFLQETQQRA